jgi:hypothetical protein
VALTDDGTAYFEQLRQLALGMSAAQFMATVRWADDPRPLDPRPAVS